MACGEEVRLRAPLTTVRLDGREHLAVPLFRGRALDGLRSLTLSVSVPRDAWEHFATCPYLGRLEELNLNSRGPAAELVTALIGSVGLGALRDLWLRECALGDEQTDRLVRHPWVARLRSLDLSNNNITAEGGAAVADSPHLDGLEALNLKANELHPESRVADRLRQRFGGRVRL